MRIYVFGWDIDISCGGRLALRRFVNRAFGYRAYLSVDQLLHIDSITRPITDKIWGDLVLDLCTELETKLSILIRTSFQEHLVFLWSFETVIKVPTDIKMTLSYLFHSLFRVENYLELCLNEDIFTIFYLNCFV